MEEGQGKSQNEWEMEASFVLLNHGGTLEVVRRSTDTLESWIDLHYGEAAPGNSCIPSIKIVIPNSWIQVMGMDRGSLKQVRQALESEWDMHSAFINQRLCDHKIFSLWPKFSFLIFKWITPALFIQQYEKCSIPSMGSINIICYCYDGY